MPIRTLGRLCMYVLRDQRVICSPSVARLGKYYVWMLWDQRGGVFASSPLMIEHSIYDDNWATRPRWSITADISKTNPDQTTRRSVLIDHGQTKLRSGPLRSWFLKIVATDQSCFTSWVFLARYTRLQILYRWRGTQIIVSTSAHTTDFLWLLNPNRP